MLGVIQSIATRGAPRHDYAQHFQRIKSLLTQLESRMVVTVTLTFSPKMAFRTFSSLNSKGKPLEIEDVLRACLVSEQSADRSGADVLLRR
jgi:hypothetical protein